MEEEEGVKIVLERVDNYVSTTNISYVTTITEYLTLTRSSV